jgi:hypothetical protein
MRGLLPLIDIAELKAALDQFVGHTCWSVIAGEGTGSARAGTRDTTTNRVTPVTDGLSRNS